MSTIAARALENLGSPMSAYQVREQLGDAPRSRKLAGRLEALEALSDLERPCSCLAMREILRIFK